VVLHEEGLAYDIPRMTLREHLTYLREEGGYGVTRACRHHHVVGCDGCIPSYCDQETRFNNLLLLLGKGYPKFNEHAVGRPRRVECSCRTPAYLRGRRLEALHT
jgi:hypothetical protein